jgi:hypothetical protein
MGAYLTQSELAARWLISERTLEGWRYRMDDGPGFTRFGRAVRYPLTAVEEFEAENFCTIVQHRNGRAA